MRGNLRARIRVMVRMRARVRVMVRIRARIRVLMVRIRARIREREGGVRGWSEAEAEEGRRRVVLCM